MSILLILLCELGLFKIRFGGKKSSSNIFSRNNELFARRSCKF
jgi:hypothetical protein